MFDIGFWEIAIIGVIALIVIGPEKLPGVARNVGAWIGKGKRLIGSVQADINQELNRADELKKLLEEQKNIIKNSDIVSELQKTIPIGGQTNDETTNKTASTITNKNTSKNTSNSKKIKSKAKTKAGTNTHSKKSDSANFDSLKKDSAKKNSVKKNSAKRDSIKNSNKKNSTIKTSAQQNDQ